MGFSEGDGGHWGSVGVIGGSVRISVQYIYTRKGELLNLFILARPIFDHAHQKIFYQLLIFVNLYQHVKHCAVSSIRYGEAAELKKSCNMIG